MRLSGRVPPDMSVKIAAFALRRPPTRVYDPVHYYGSYGHGSFHLGSWVILLIAGYLALHVLGGAIHHTARRRRGHRVNLGWSLLRGPWASSRVFGGTYYRHL